MATDTCSHLDLIDESVTPSSTEGCSECLRIGGTWVHLRECMICGEVGCCDNSPNKHATKHFHEDWYWCYVDEFAFRLAG